MTSPDTSRRSPRAPARRNVPVEVQQVPSVAPKESEHLHSLAFHCQGLAKDITDAEMAQAFRTLASDYLRRATRLAAVGR